MNERSKLMKKIQMIDFMLVDLALYLDTHPTCRNAIEYYRRYMKLREDAYKEFTSKFGTFIRSEIDPTDNWEWIDSPWPWEREAN